jgi:transposase
MTVSANDETVSATDLHQRVSELSLLCDSLRAERDQATQHAQTLEKRTQRLTLQVKRLAYLLYGRRSEKLSAEELGQLVLALGGDEENAHSAEPTVPVSAVPEETLNDGADECTGKRKRRKHPGRTKLSPMIERVVIEVPVPEDERACKCCNHPMAVISHLEHERVEHVAEKLVAHIERREVLGCKNSQCRGDAVTAPRKQAPAVVRRAGNSLFAHLIESKCDDALPIYRQRDQLSRLGFDLPLNTLYGYWTHGTDMLAPVAAVTLSTLLGDDVVNLDDTKLKVLDKEHPKGRYLGHLWCFTGISALVAYTFTQTWQADEIAPFIAAIEGFIQCDDYKGYSAKIRGPDGCEHILVPPERRLGCMMHVRRRFYAALQLGDKRAALPVAFIRELYLIEAQAKTAGLDALGRRALRQHKSLPWLDRFDQWVDEHDGKLLPSSKLAEAVGYASQQRPFIRRCFEDGRFEIDNGKVERAIREPAIGRRNYHFTGSQDAAKRLAGAYTLVQSCRALGIRTRDYLIDVLDKLDAGWPMRRIAELVPDRWAIDRGLISPTNQTQ